MLEKCKPLLVNDMFQLYLQQKYNINSEQFVYSFNVNYFLNEEEAKNIDADFFEEFFEEVHVTPQEDGEYLLELFDLKKFLVQEFDDCYEKKLLDPSYLHIIEFLDKQELLINKNSISNFDEIIRLSNRTAADKQPDWYLDLVSEKYLYLKHRYDIPFLIVPTPYIKRNSSVEEALASYFGSYFQEIKVQTIEVNGQDYIKAIHLGELRKAYSISYSESFTNLMQRE